jgi:hypothetical protein
MHFYQLVQVLADVPLHWGHFTASASSSLIKTRTPDRTIGPRSGNPHE